MKSLKPSVVLISVDALKPEFVFEQARLGIALPNITRYFLNGGASAPDGVESVFPPFTYPCHQSIITGVNPATHGIDNNVIFDPTGVHNGAWHWFASRRVQTLWEAAKNSGYYCASVEFPTSVGAKGDWIAPEYWWDGSELDSAFIDAVAYPQGLIAEMERDIGRYASGLDLTDDGDKQRYRATMWMLDKKLAPHLSEKPFFLSAYFASFDESAHVHGVYSAQAAESLQKIDAMLGALIAKIHRIAGENAVVCVVSDHGTLDNAYNIFPNCKLQQAGLITTDANGKVTDWKAWSQRAGGISEIRIKDANDEETRAILAQVVAQLKADENSGILEVLDTAQAVARGGFPNGAYVLVAKKGYEIRDEATGAYCRTTLTQRAQHGYSEQFPEMRASFMIEGKGIAAGQKLPGLRLIDIAPTLANIMGFTLTQAEGVNIL